VSLDDLLAASESSWPPSATFTDTAPVVVAGYQHDYLSTACLHHRHDYYCSGTDREDGSTKTPACCKFCSAPCRCTCHQTGGDRG
jgi:hypothetical protein